MNALKHAEARNIWITVKPDGDEVEMVLRDDGVGFDVEAPEPEGHFGLTMMRERARVGGGSLTMVSAPAQGATLTVRFPTSWLQEEGEEGAAATSAPAPGPATPDGASPGTDPTPSSSAAESVPA